MHLRGKQHKAVAVVAIVQQETKSDKFTTDKSRLRMLLCNFDRPTFSTRVFNPPCLPCSKHLLAAQDLQHRLHHLLALVKNRKI